MKLSPELPWKWKKRMEDRRRKCKPLRPENVRKKGKHFKPFRKWVITKSKGESCLNAIFSLVIWQITRLTRDFDLTNSFFFSFNLFIFSIVLVVIVPPTILWCSCVHCPCCLVYKRKLATRNRIKEDKERKARLRQEQLAQLTQNNVNNSMVVCGPAQGNVVDYGTAHGPGYSSG